MKNIKNNITRILLFTSALATAQTPFEDDVVDVPAAPIDQWELPMFLIGTITVVYFIYKKAQQSKNV